MSKIGATVVADSIDEYDNRLITFEAILPRFILAELNTHRMLSKNSASSRAIPFKKMLEMVKTDPFIPIAWQKEHKGMQGSEYFTEEDTVNQQRSYWLKARDEAINWAEGLTNIGTTKQLANRLLEPFMYHKVLISGTEWSNFFELRTPIYEIEGYRSGTFRSKKDASNAWGGKGDCPKLEDTLGWLAINKGQAEIHMMALAEAIWDAYNESKPKLLKAGEWHIPYEDKIVLPPTIPIDEGYSLQEGVDIRKIKISIAMCARTSYTIVGEEKGIDNEALISLHDRMSTQVPFHASPFEHCAKVMTEDEYSLWTRGLLTEAEGLLGDRKLYNSGYTEGWCRNFRGFIQYREILENKFGG